MQDVSKEFAKCKDQGDRRLDLSKLSVSLLKTVYHYQGKKYMYTGAPDDFAPEMQKKSPQKSKRALKLL